MRKRIRLVLPAAAVVLLLGWVFFQVRYAVVTVHFAPRQPGEMVDYLFLTVGSTKLHTQGLRGGEKERFIFEPSPDEPLEMGFWIHGTNGGWEGPVLRPRHRLHVTLEENGHVTYEQCFWPC